MLDGNETEVRIDSCSGEGEDEIEITVLWEEPEKKGAGASFEPGEGLKLRKKNQPL